MITPWITVPASLGLLLGLLGLVGALARHQGWDAEWARKAIHISLGLYCLSFPWLFDGPGPVVLVCGLALAALTAIRLNRALRDGLGHGLLGVARHSYGEMLFAAAVAVTFALTFGLHPGPKVAYLLPIAILTLSDAAAALVGSHYGRQRFRVADGGKSWEGVAIFFLTAWVLAMILLLLASPADRLSVVVLGAVIAAYGSLVEATSWRGLDNLFVPLALNLLLIHHLNTDPGWLALAALGFLLPLAIALHQVRQRGIDPHGVCFLATSLATIALASHVWMALPALLLLPCLALRPDNEAARRLGLAILALGLGWYLLNQLAGIGTLHGYTTSLLALAALILAGAGGSGWRWGVLPVIWAAGQVAAVSDYGGLHLSMPVQLLTLAGPALLIGLGWWWRPWQHRFGLLLTPPAAFAAALPVLLP